MGRLQVPILCRLLQQTATAHAAEIGVAVDAQTRGYRTLLLEKHDFAKGTSSRSTKLVHGGVRYLQQGNFSLVLEAVPAPVAERITRELSIPTIGIGAGVDCDGQVLVWHDLLGLYEGRSPRFVKRYADVGQTIRSALEAYASDVRERRFPEEQHTYAMPEEELALFVRATRDRADAASDRDRPTRPTG